MKSKNKKRSMVIGSILIILILISGTFAFQQFEQGAFNPAWDAERIVENVYGGRVHDDFEDRHGPGAYDKDIYAENFGNTDLFVRIQLREFLSIDGDAIGNAVISDPSTWPIYRAEADDATFRLYGTYTHDIGEEGIQWTLGNPDGVQKIFMPTHNHVTHPVAAVDILGTVPAPFNVVDAYRFSNTTGRGVEQIAGGFLIEDQASAQDIHVYGIQTGASVSDGTHGFWEDGDTYESYLIYINDDGEMTAEEDVVHVARPTLPADYGGVMTLTQWEDAERPEGNFWIMDTEDEGGWFYWNGYLPAGQATSLLLNGIYIPDRLEAWEYVIYLNADFFTLDSIDDLPGGITAYAREIFPRNLVIPEDIINTRGAIWTDSTGVAWRVLEPANVEGHGGLGNALLIKEMAVGGSGQPLLISNINAWFANNGAPEFQQIGMDTMVPPAIGTSLDVDSGENTFMVPNPATVGSPRVFPLSQVESAYYFTSALDRQTRDSVSGAIRGWMLRSIAPGTGMNNAHMVASNGNNTTGSPGSHIGMRPAIWVTQ